MLHLSARDHLHRPIPIILLSSNQPQVQLRHSTRKAAAIKDLLADAKRAEQAAAGGGDWAADEDSSGGTRALLRALGLADGGKAEGLGLGTAGVGDGAGSEGSEGGLELGDDEGGSFDEVSSLLARLGRAEVGR